MNVDKLPEIIELQRPDGTIKKIPKDKFVELLETKFILTKNNTVFLKPSVKWGIIPQWCTHYYNIRKQAKRGTVIEANKGNKALSDLLQAKNTGYKLLLNSVYGITGSKYCPFFNPDIAQSITKQGQFCNKSSEKFIHNKFAERFNIADNYVTVASGDTDSVRSDTTIEIDGSIS